MNREPKLEPPLALPAAPTKECRYSSIGMPYVIRYDGTDERESDNYSNENNKRSYAELNNNQCALRDAN
jgi:hypothetical protein